MHYKQPVTTAYITKFKILFDVFYLREKRFALAFPWFFFARRGVLAFTIVLMKGKPTNQVFVYIVGSLFNLCILAYERPFKVFRFWVIEIFNELCIFLTGFLMLGYTPFVYGLDAGKPLGFTFISVVLFATIVNALHIFFLTGHCIYEYVKRKQLEKKFAKVDAESDSPREDNLEKKRGKLATIQECLESDDENKPFEGFAPLRQGEETYR